MSDREKDRTPQSPTPHEDEEAGGPERSGVTRRGFLTSVGAGAVAVTAGGRLVAEASATPVVEPAEMARVTFSINGRRHHLLVEPRWTLLFVLREKLGLTGTKEGCSRGECGACTVLQGDQPRYACMTLAVEAAQEAGAPELTTVEGLLDGEELGPVQQAFLEHDAYQCGYCTPGQIMAAEGLLRSTVSPGRDEIRQAMSGNLCRCGAYPHITSAVERAAELRRTGEKGGRS